jgi:alkanesulfonate monooxygenase SsuD/methylene tetrahydromethanopterin reductase-like flavin-dependent oxidoreductase (luciferase family)
MQFSVWPQISRPWSEVLTAARSADEGEWYRLYVADHYMPNTDDETIVDGDMFEAWSVLAALAAVTDRIGLGTLVSPTTVHHPALLANRAATIDHVSAGRFVLGLGAGWQINEHRAYGIELYEPRARVDRFDEAIQILRSLLAGGRTTFAGEHFHVTDAPCDPTPVGPLPLLVGSAGHRMMRIVARHADEWNRWGDPDEAATLVGKLDEACADVGRDPATLRRSIQALVFLTEDADVIERRKAAFPGRVIAGSTSELVDTIGQYGELGFEEFILPDGTLGRELPQRLEALAQFWSEIATPLR